MSRARPARWEAVVTAVAAAISVAAIGSTLTDLGPWYQSLKEPAWKPPDAAFGVIWTVIFALAAISGVQSWQRMPDLKSRQWILGLFALNGFLNVFWSLIFFKVQRPDLALVEVGFLWLSVLALMVFLYRRAPVASLLLAPYLLWVTIAAALNYEVVALNGPFA